MFSWLSPPRRPLIVAHRGSSAGAPENTLAAFSRAFTEGADAIELDVRLSGDGEAVVIHDRLLDRTTNGHGPVAGGSLGELRTLSAGAWFHRRFATERIPTLVEVFGILPEDGGINIELKSDRGHGRSWGLVDRCCDLIIKHGMSERALVSSFNRRYLARARRTEPSIPIGLLYHPVLHAARSPVSLAASLGARYLVLNGSRLRRRIVSAAHAHGILLAEYTVNTHNRLDRALRFGDDAIITDVPSMVSQVLRRRIGRP